MSHNSELAQLDSGRQVEYRKKFQMVRQSLVSIGFLMEVSVQRWSLSRAMHRLSIEGCPIDLHYPIGDIAHWRCVFCSTWFQ